MKNNTLYLLTIVVAIWGCNQSVCINDLKFKEQFENCVTFASMIANSKYGLDGIDSEQESKLIRTLEVLTKRKSKIEFNHGIAWYKDQSDFKEDSIAWLTWFDANKCTMTIGMAEDTLTKYREPLPDYSNKEVLKRIEEMYPIELRDSVRYLDSILNVKYQLDWPKKMDINVSRGSR